MNHQITPLPSGDFKVNALGQPSPNRTDFKGWSRENLEAFARQAADENLVLRAESEELKAETKAFLGAWRDVIVRGAGCYHMAADSNGRVAVTYVGPTTS